MTINIKELRKEYDHHMRVPSSQGFMYVPFPELMDAYEERDLLRSLLAEVLPCVAFKLGEEMANERVQESSDLMVLIRRVEEVLKP